MGSFGRAGLFRLRGEIDRLTALVDMEIAAADQSGDTDPASGYLSQEERRLATAIAWSRANDLRCKVLNLETLQDPQWNVLLDLYISHFKGGLPSVSSACVASGVPATTALRHIAMLVAEHRVVRIDDERDRRRTYLALSPESVEMMHRLMDQVIESDRRYGLERGRLTPSPAARL